MGLCLDRICACHLIPTSEQQGTAVNSREGCGCRDIEPDQTDEMLGCGELMKTGVTLPFLS